MTRWRYDEMHTHTVFFWLRGNLSDADHRAFQNGLDLLSRQPQIRDRRIGKPATTKRPVVDSTYSYAIVLSFDDTNAHDAYQVSAEHKTFLDTCSSMISRVQVYDFIEPEVALPRHSSRDAILAEPALPAVIEG